MSMDKFWEDQWSSQMEGWATQAKHAQATNHYMPRTCHSPSGSESSFSVSTRDSPSLSAQSEASSCAAKYMHQSSNPEIKHTKSLSMESVSREFTETDKQQDWMFLQERGIFEKIQHFSNLNASGLLQRKLENSVEAKERLVQSPTGLVHSTQEVSDEGWLSDGMESWASALSQELSCNHLFDGGAEDVLSSTLYEASKNTHPTNQCQGPGERDQGAMEQAHHAAHPVVSSECNDENANISKKPSYAEFNNDIASLDNEGCIHESICLQSTFDNRTCATHSAPPGSLGSREHVNNSNVDALHKQQELDTYCRRNVDCAVEDHQELPVQAGDGHQPFAYDMFEAQNIALQPQESDFYRSNSRKSGSSPYIESTSHPKQAHLKSRHSAAVADKYPSSSSHGNFRFVELDGSQCYSFSVHDSDEVFFARPCQPEHESNGEDRNCLYTFHSRRNEGKTKGGRKSSLKKEKLASSLVGKMKVSNAKHMRTENIYVEETHFVLYGKISQLPAENEAFQNNQTSGQLDSEQLRPISGSKSKFSKRKLDSHSQKFKQRDDCDMSTPGAAGSQGVIQSRSHGPIHRDGMSRHGFADANIECCSNHSIVKQDMTTTQMELAAIVITTTAKEQKATRKEAYESSHKYGDGWGAAFLERRLKRGSGAGVSGKSSASGSRLEPTVAVEEDLQQFNAADHTAFKSNMERLQERRDSAEIYPKSGSMANAKVTQKGSCSNSEQPKIGVDVVVILPAGHHGLPRHDSNCPTEDGPCEPASLLKCWQSGGNCDCGGWDMGCGLSVLKSETLQLLKERATMALTSCDRINWILPEKPLQIFTQGYKPKKLLMLEIIQTGLFSLSFQARFSALQAFATAVAIFHEQITH